MFIPTETSKESEIYERYCMLFYHRSSFLRLKRSAQLIQQAVRSWLYSRHQQKHIFDLQTNAANSIQLAWKNFICCKSTRKQHLVATKIQCNIRRWLLRKRFLNQIQAVIKVQSYFRMWRCVNAFQNFKTVFKAAIAIQSFFRGWVARKDAYARRNQIIEIQVRHWLMFFCS